MCQVFTEVEHTEILKSFINDIVWLSFGNQAMQNIKTKLSETFAKYDLTLKYRDINTTEENGKLEFLDHKFLPIPNFDSSPQTTLNQQSLTIAFFKVPNTTQLQYSN